MTITMVLFYYSDPRSQYLAGCKVLALEPLKGLFTKPGHGNPNGSFLLFLHRTLWHRTRVFFFQISCFRNCSLRCTHVRTYNLQVRVSKLVQALAKQQNKQRRALFGCFQQKERCIDLTNLMMCYYLVGKLLWLLVDTRIIDPTQKGVRSYKLKMLVTREAIA